MRSGADVASARRAQIVNLSLAELMLLLVFMTITFSFLAKEEGLVEVPRVQKQLAEARAEIAHLKEKVLLLTQQRNAAQAQLDKLERFLRSLGIDARTLSPRTVDGMTFEQALAYGEKQKILVEQLESENAALHKKIAGGKAPGLPICLMTGTHLLEFELLADGFIRGQPSWSAGADELASSIPGVKELTGGSPYSSQAMLIQSAKISAWGRLQEKPCTFAVKVRRLTNDADLFDQQLRAVERYFYVSRVK